MCRIEGRGEGKRVGGGIDVRHMWGEGRHFERKRGKGGISGSRKGKFGGRRREKETVICDVAAGG